MYREDQYKELLKWLPGITVEHNPVQDRSFIRAYGTTVFACGLHSDQLARVLLDMLLHAISPKLRAVPYAPVGDSTVNCKADTRWQALVEVENMVEEAIVSYTPGGLHLTHLGRIKTAIEKLRRL